MDSSEAGLQKEETLDGAESNALLVREKVLLELILKANSLKARRLFGGSNSGMIENGGIENDQMRIVY